MILPDKHVRRAVYQAVNNIEVAGVQIPCYDLRATGYSGDYFILMSTQTATPQSSKCGHRWESTIELQVVGREDKNVGSRLGADDVLEAVLTALEPLELDPASGLTILHKEIELITDLTTETDAEIVYQKIVRYRLDIN